MVDVEVAEGVVGTTLEAVTTATTTVAVVVEAAVEATEAETVAMAEAAVVAIVEVAATAAEATVVAGAFRNATIVLHTLTHFSHIFTLLPTTVATAAAVVAEEVETLVAELGKGVSANRPFHSVVMMTSLE